MRRLILLLFVLLNIAAACEEDTLETITGVGPAATPSITIVVATPEG